MIQTPRFSWIIDRDQQFKANCPTMALFLRALLAIVCNWFSAWWKSPSNNSLNQTQLRADCFVLDSERFLRLLNSHKSLEELQLEGFIFNEANVVKFSKTIIKLKIEKLTLTRCDIGNNLVNYLSIPPTIKSVRLEQLNLSAKGIQCFVSKMPLSLESLEIRRCFGNECDKQIVPLDLSHFIRLKHVWFENLSELDLDFPKLLISLTTLSLESIKLWDDEFGTDEWVLAFEGVIDAKNASFFSTLQVFDLKSSHVDKDNIIKLVHHLISFPCLEVFSFQIPFLTHQISLPTLPPKIKQFILEGFDEVFIDNNNSFDCFRKIRNDYESNSIFNLSFLSKFKLSHLTVSGDFPLFPYEFFCLNQLEYLDLLNIRYSCDPLYEDNCSYGNLTFLAVRSVILQSFLPDFVGSFPAIQTLYLHVNDSAVFDQHLNEIFSSETLKCLKLYYYRNNEKHLKFDVRITSPIEELKLNGVHWKFVSCLFKNVQFPSLKKLTIRLTTKELEFYTVLEKLHLLSQLTSLTLTGKFGKQQLTEPSFEFKNLRRFKLSHFNDSLNLVHLSYCMPNLIEFRLNGWISHNFVFQRPTSIRYLSATPDFYKSNRNVLINFVKNMPNLIQFRRALAGNLVIENELLVIDLAYYLKTLKSHFNNELKFEIKYNCFPILLLGQDKYLHQLVRSKSASLQGYLKQKFPLSVFGKFIKQLFTFDIGNIFDIETINAHSFVQLFKLIEKLGLHGSGDILSVVGIIRESANGSIEKLNNFSVDHFYDSLASLLEKKTNVKLQQIHLNFIEKYITKNMHKSMKDNVQFLISLFDTLSKADNVIDYETRYKLIDRNLFQLFVDNIFARSFVSLFDKIKNGQLSENLKLRLLSIYSFNYDCLSLRLQNLDSAQYEQLISFFNRRFFNCVMMVNLVEVSFLIFKTLMTNETSCSICFDSFQQEELKLFESSGSNFCHLFHRKCLDKWLRENDSCPLCRERI